MVVWDVVVFVWDVVVLVLDWDVVVFVWDVVVFDWDVFVWDVFFWEVLVWDVLAWDEFAWDVLTWDVFDGGIVIFPFLMASSVAKIPETDTVALLAYNNVKFRSNDDFESNKLIALSLWIL